jgi:hypothetical protein
VRSSNTNLIFIVWHSCCLSRSSSVTLLLLPVRNSSIQLSRIETGRKIRFGSEWWMTTRSVIPCNHNGCNEACHHIYTSKPIKCYYRIYRDICAAGDLTFFSSNIMLAIYSLIYRYILLETILWYRCLLLLPFVLMCFVLYSPFSSESNTKCYETYPERAKLAKRVMMASE